MTAQAVDPKAWAESAAGLPAAGLVLAAVFVVLAFVVLIWRGSEKLGITGVGSEVKLLREALIKDLAETREERSAELRAMVDFFKASAESDKRLRREFRVVMKWAANAYGVAGPPLDDADEDSDPAIALPPARTRAASVPDAQAGAPTSRQGRQRRG